MTDTNFFDRVYKVVQRIPYGKVSTYGAIAKAVGSPGAARMVGWALNKCSGYSSYVPAHRVVNRQGLLTGKHYFGGQNVMEDLLVSEGIEIADNKIVNITRYLWEPEVGLYL